MKTKMVKLGDIATIYNGNSINKNVKKEKYTKNVPGWNYIGTKDIDYDGSITYNNGVIIPYSETGFKIAPAGSVFVCSEGGSAGKKTALVKEDVCFGNKLFAIVNDKGLFQEKYVFFYTRYSKFSEQFKQLATSLMGGISSKNFATIEIPLVEIEDQKRIVNKIEELFSELDSAVETLKKTKEQLAVYRQSVLKEAFESQKDCRSVPISEITDDIRIGPFGTMLHKEDYILNGIPVINPQHIKSGRICPSPKVSISKEKMKELSSYQLKKNDIVMGRRGEMGRCAAVTDVENGWLCGTGSILFRLKSDFDAEFYSKILSSPNVVHYLEENATGTTMKNLNEEIVKQVPVPYMTKRMQQKIHSKIETSLSICENIEKTVNDALMQADAMRQSILKKAFEGGI